MKSTYTYIPLSQLMEWGIPCTQGVFSLSKMLRIVSKNPGCCPIVDLLIDTQNRPNFCLRRPWICRAMMAVDVVKRGESGACSA